MKLNKIKMDDRLCRSIGLILLGFVLLAYFILIMKNGNNIIDSDDASELMLSRLLASEHAPITRNWLYSYELRVLNIQLVFTPLFWIFHSWKLVRAVGGVILLLIYTGLYYLVYRAWHLDLKWFYLTAFSLVMPYASPLYYFNLKMFYIPHIAITFAALALFGKIVHSEGRLCRIGILLLFVLAFFAGLGGTRSVLLTFAPLFLAGFVLFLEDPSKLKEWLISTAALFFSGAGFIINDRILSRLFQYRSYSNLSFIKFNFQRLEDILNSILNSYGYSVGEYFISLKGILDACAIMLAVLMLTALFLVLIRRRELEQPARFVYYFIALTFLLNTFVVLFGQLVNDEYSDRYITIGLVPLILLPCMAYPLSRIPSRIKKPLLLICLSSVFLMGLLQYRQLFTYAGNAPRQGYLRFLEEEGLDYGYASFWNANVTTELTDGKVQMTSLVSAGDHFEITYHLVSTKLLEEHHDRCFLLLTSHEAGVFMLGDEKLNEHYEPVYQDETYSIYEFDYDLDEVYSKSE